VDYGATATDTHTSSVPRRTTSRPSAAAIGAHGSSPRPRSEASSSWARALWRHAGGPQVPSPLGHDGRVQARGGTTTVLALAPTLRVVARNDLDDTFIASPAASRDELFLRGSANLYCIATSTSSASSPDGRTPSSPGPSRR